MAIFDPITLPIAISGWPVKAEYTLTISSGADVAKDTTVKPITTIETLILIARATEPLTKKSPPSRRSTSPKKK